MVGVGALALQAVPAIMDMVGAQIQKKKDQKFGDFLIKQAEKTPTYQMADTYNKYLAMAKQDPVGDFMREQAARNQATSIGALKSGGAKSILGGLGAVQQQAFADQAKIAGASQENLQSAMLNYGQAQQSVANLNVEQAQKKLDAITQAEFYKKNAKDMARQAMFQGGEELFNAGMNFAGANNFFKKQPPGAVGGLLKSLEGMPDQTYEERMAAVRSAKMLGDSIIPQDPFFNPVNPWLQQQPSFYNRKNGGRIQKTPGSFNHKTNPIDIVAKGSKIGEMTGGEYILNPAQAAKMQSLASSQKKEALQRYVKTLFTKFNNK